MDSIKNNKVLAAVFWLAILGALGLGALAYTSYSTYQESLLSLEDVNQKLSNVEGAKLYPSKENMEKLAEQVNQYETSVGKLTQVLLHLQVPAEPILDTDFQAKLKERIATTRADAEKARVALPKNFNLGFDAYTSNLPKSPEAARQLHDYVQSVDAIVQACIKCGAVSVDALSRSEIEVEKPDAPPPPPPSAAEKRNKSKSRTKSKAPVPVVEMTKVTERRQVSLDLTLDQPALLALLNTLADANAMPYFTVVRMVHLENEKLDGPPRSLTLPPNPAGNVSDENTPVAPKLNADGTPVETKPTAEVIEPAKPDHPDALAVMGHEKLKVHLEIDVVRYQEAPAVASAK